MGKKKRKKEIGIIRKGLEDRKNERSRNEFRVYFCFGGVGKFTLFCMCMCFVVLKGILVFKVFWFGLIL